MRGQDSAVEVSLGRGISPIGVVDEVDVAIWKFNPGRVTVVGYAAAGLTSPPFHIGAGIRGRISMDLQHVVDLILLDGVGSRTRWRGVEYIREKILD